MTKCDGYESIKNWLNCIWLNPKYNAIIYVDYYSKIDNQQPRLE